MSFHTPRRPAVPAAALAWALATLMGPAAQAQSEGRAQAQALSFDRALALATAQSPMLAARQAAADAAQQLRTSAAELPDPRVSVGLDNLPISGPERWRIGGEPMTQRSLGWMQDMPNRAKRAARADGAQARSERERALLQAERLAVQREVAQAWLARWYAERQLALFTTLERENALLLDTVAARVAAARAMPGEATMARQDALLLADRRDELERERRRAQAALARWLGLDALAPLEGGPPPMPLDPASLRAGIAGHSDLLAFAPMLRMTQAERQELQAAKHGDWSWQLGYGRRGAGYGDMVSFQLTFELPLAAATRQDPQIAAKRHEAERIAAERDDALRRRLEEVDMQLAELAELDNKLARLQQAALALAEERVTLALAAYQANRGDLTAVLAARRERAELGMRALDLQARAAALRTKLNYLTGEAR
jgi:outer membrane protein TolC